jgi:TolB-like protein/DNA-binding winged helix-turn-helix (wHTH) protein/Tfp pilus assembly protein PilF
MTGAVDQGPTVFSFGPFRLDTARRSLEKSGVPVLLSARAYDMLQLLVENRDHVVSREALVAHAWPGVTVEASNLTVQMSALRRALGDTGAEPGLIATVPGRGYRFVGHLAEDERPLPSPVVAAGLEVAPRAVRAGGQRLAVGVGVAAAVVCAIAGGWWVMRGGGGDGRPPLSIVVMPFRNLGGGSAQDYLADAISDDLTTDLAHIPGSLVIARDSADVYKSRPASAAAIGRALNVRYLLEGSLRAQGGTMRVNAQLIDTTNNAHLWAQRFDESTAQLWDAQTDTVHRIASGLSVALVNEEAARATRERPNDPNALDLFFRARSILDRATTLEDMTAAQRLLERAVSAQPDFVDALATLGWLLVRKQQAFQYAQAAADDAEANRVIGHALALAPHNAAVLAANGRLLESDGKCAEARAAFDAALTAEPGNVLALYGEALCAWSGGQPDQVVPMVTKVLQIDPLGPALAFRYQLLGLAKLFAGHAREAVVALSHADAQAGPPPAAVDTPSQMELTRVYLIAATWLAGDHEAARRRYADFKAIWPRRSVWRLTTYLTRAQAGVAYFAAIEQALVDAGMPRFGDAAADEGVAPSAGPLSGGDYRPTPMRVPGVVTIDTAALRQLMAAKAAPIVLDVGDGVAVPPGAVMLAEENSRFGGDALGDAGFLARLRAAPGVVVMSDFCTGPDGYNAALRVRAAGVSAVYWYRGGEEAWAASGLAAVDRRRP